MNSNTHTYFNLKKLKVDTLKQITRLMGLNHVPTKTALIGILLSSLRDGGIEWEEQSGIPGKLKRTGLSEASLDDNPRTVNQAPRRILSIDMGVQNLAYSELEVPPLDYPSNLTAKGDLRTWLKIRNWRRLPIEEIPQSLELTQHLDSLENPQLGESALSDDLRLYKPQQQFSWHPETMAARASHLFNELVLSKPRNERPAAILIERQRWRTGGASAVLEWTLRVNTFEAMLWATATTARMHGLWSGQLYGVDPAKVSSWWLPEKEEDKTQPGLTYAARQRQTKKMKIQVVKDWLQRKEMVSGDENSASVKSVLDAFGENRVKHSRRKAPARKSAQDNEPAKKIPSTSVNQENKLDDLADCLLQGVAFMQWEKNRRSLIEVGLEPFMKEHRIIDAAIEKRD